MPSPRFRACTSTRTIATAGCGASSTRRGRRGTRGTGRRWRRAGGSRASARTLRASCTSSRPRAGSSSSSRGSEWMAGDPLPTPEELEALRAAIPPLVHLGTSSWNYPGWQGLVYHQKYPKSGASGKMLAEYARWPLFSTVGIDSSFYNPPSEKVLQEYAAALPAGFKCVSKVWDRITVHTHSKLREKAKAGEANPDFLNPELFTEAMLSPYLRHFADHTGPFVFEFQAMTRGAKLAPLAFADTLDRFFGALPREAPYAVEVRNPEFLTPAYFAVLREHGVG